jgi:Winged helix-turn helix
MAGPRRPRVIALSDAMRAELVRLTRSPAVAAGLARRARIVLLAAEEVPLRQIGPRVGVSRTVGRDWLDRCRAQGLAGLQDRPRSGRPRTFSPCGGPARHPPRL